MSTSVHFALLYTLYHSNNLGQLTSMAHPRQDSLSSTRVTLIHYIPGNTSSSIYDILFSGVMVGEHFYRFLAHPGLTELCLYVQRVPCVSDK